MNKNTYIKTMPNWYVETVACISNYINGNNNVDNTIENSKKYGYNKVEMEEYFDKFKNYQNTITEAIIPTFNSKYKELEPYFKKTRDENCMISPFVNYYSELLNDNITDEIIDDIFFSILKNIREDLLDIDDKEDDFDYSNLSNIVNFLKIVDFDDDEKLQIINFHVNRYKLTKLLINLLNELSSICQKYFYIIEDEYNKSIEYIQSRDDFHKSIKELVGIDYQLNWQTDVTVTILCYNKLSMKCQDNNTKILIGMYMFFLSNLANENRFDDANIVSDLKAIGDVTRFKIIRLLANKPMYLQELANNLKLTPATVSHHINILLQAEFLSVVLDIENSKRICYELKLEKIDYLTETLKTLVKNNI